MQVFSRLPAHAVAAPIDAGPNQDAPTYADPAAGDLRWRHAGDDAANLAALDGSARGERFNGEVGAPRGTNLASTLTQAEITLKF